MSVAHDFSSSLIPILHVAAALAAGGVIGIERTFRGRAAGFRTYALVCMGSAMAMVIAVFPGSWLAPGTDASGDVTRIVQGILTGIGFLGAGIIVKHGFSIRGLTTAASIWTTAVIGILIGGEISDRTQRHDIVAAVVFILTAIITVIIAAVATAISTPSAVRILLPSSAPLPCGSA